MLGWRGAINSGSAQSSKNASYATEHILTVPPGLVHDGDGNNGDDHDNNDIICHPLLFCTRHHNALIGQKCFFFQDMLLSMSQLKYTIHHDIMTDIHVLTV